ncbi:hypothetical protein DFH27DRAFT_134326 [Peziza echinospora]|nr:hypothetical protein DFH27DRAFT_134326 [Peziza echinospora]
MEWEYFVMLFRFCVGDLIFQFDYDLVVFIGISLFLFLFCFPLYNLLPFLIFTNSTNSLFESVFFFPHPPHMLQLGRFIIQHYSCGHPHRLFTSRFLSLLSFFFFCILPFSSFLLTPYVSFPVFYSST